MNTTEDSIDSLRNALKAFAMVRDWEQFQSPKNLSMALAGECGEVLEHFQWLTEQASATLSEHQLREVELELADVFIYTVRLADVLGVDLLAAARDKIAINESRYPAQQVKGDARRAHAYSHYAAQTDSNL